MEYIGEMGFSERFYFSEYGESAAQEVGSVINGNGFVASEI
jgi:hypothetical protein